MKSRSRRTALFVRVGIAAAFACLIIFMLNPQHVPASQTTAETSAESSQIFVPNPSYEPEKSPSDDYKIPNIVHMIFGLDHTYTGKFINRQPKWSYIHYLSVVSAWRNIKPRSIMFHHGNLPAGKWWDLSKPYLTLVRARNVTEIFGVPVRHFAHKADIIRLEVLKKYGGIYLDADVVTLRSFDSLRKHSVVMARQHVRKTKIEICNAVILATPNAPFLERMYQSYSRDFKPDECYACHSVILTGMLAKQYPKEIHVEPADTFFRPGHLAPEQLFVQNTYDFSKNLAIHLFESQFHQYLEMVTPDYVATEDNTFAKMVRFALPPELYDPDSMQQPVAPGTSD